MSIRDLTPDDVTKLKLPGLAGVMVEEVEKDSAASKGGVLKGDVATPEEAATYALSNVRP